MLDSFVFNSFYVSLEEGQSIKKKSRSMNKSVTISICSILNLKLNGMDFGLSYEKCILEYETKG